MDTSNDVHDINVNSVKKVFTTNPEKMIIQPLNTYERPSPASGIYIHTPKSVNQDIYVSQEPNSENVYWGVYYYEDKEGKGYWRMTTCSKDAEKLIEYADPKSKNLGCGQYYPIYKIDLTEKYSDAENLSFITKFE